MSSRGHNLNHHRVHQGGGLPLFLKGRPFLLDRSRMGPLAANPPRVPSLDEEVHSDDEISREIENYEMEEEQVHARDPPYTYLHRTSSDKRERVRSGVLSLQLVEPHLWTLTHGISARIRTPISLTRSWISFLKSLP